MSTFPAPPVEPSAAQRTEPAPAAALTRQDRCDQCKAQAYVEMARPDAPATLLFCAHHYARNEIALSTGGWVVFVDDRCFAGAR